MSKKSASSSAKKSAKSSVKRPAKSSFKKSASSSAKKSVKPAAKKSVKPAAKKSLKPAAKKSVKPAAKKSLKPAAKKSPKPSVKTEWLRKPGWLEEVASTPERDLRGHRIALTYHGLAIDLLTWIHDIEEFDQDAIAHTDPRLNVNWFGFATWATATLNADIRNDGPPYRSDRLVPLGFRRRFTPTVLAIKAANGQRYQQLLTWYQRVVFINTTFTYRALREYDPLGKKVWASIDEAGNITTEIDPAWMKEAAELTRPAGGQSPLSVDRHFNPVLMAFEYYRRARRVSLRLQELKEEAKAKHGAIDDATLVYYVTLRARLIFFGDLIITSVEQDLVNPGVERVLNNVPTAANDVVSAHLADLAQRMLGVPRQLAGLRIPAKLQPAETAFREIWVRLLTRELLVLALPTETLRLGQDVPPVDAGEPYFPRELFDLTQLPPAPGARKGRVDDYAKAFGRHAIDNHDLYQTVMAFDRSRGEGYGTGARDWRRIVERMNWATTMLRTRIQDASLLWPPFRGEDAKRIIDGCLPLHAGNPTDFDVLGPLEGFDYLCNDYTANDREDRR